MFVCVCVRVSVCLCAHTCASAIFVFVFMASKPKQWDRQENENLGPSKDMRLKQEKGWKALRSWNKNCVTVRSGLEGRAKTQGIRGTSEGTIKTRAGPRDPRS